MNKVMVKVAKSHTGAVWANNKALTAKNNEEFELEESQAKKYVARGVVEIVEVPQDETSQDGTSQDDSFEGITKPFTEDIIKEGIETLEQLADAEVEQLKVINGIGPKIAEELIAKAKEIVGK